MQNQIPLQVQQAINFHTNRLGRMFRLQTADRDDVRQELTLKALEAMRCHRPDMKANCITYTKQAVCRRAVDLMRDMIARPVIESLPFQCCLEAVDRSFSFIVDVQSMIRTLTPRQKKICVMIMSGYDHEEIALSLGITVRWVGHEIRRIRSVLTFFLKTPKKYFR